MNNLETPRQPAKVRRKDRPRDYTAEEVAAFLREDKLDAAAQAVVARFSTRLEQEEQERLQEPA